MKREAVEPAGPGACLPDRLRLLGLREVDRILTHANRTVMVSLSARRVLRLHQGYAFASDRVLRAIVRFLNSRLPRSVRRAAEREFLAFPVEQYVPPALRAPRVERPRPGDLLLLHRLRQAHDRLNARHFGGCLTELPIRLSSRMRTRLGEVSVDLRTGQALEIALSRRHLARHPWHEVEHTLLHEMVHQWQAETGLRVDHGPTFRRKATEVGVLPQAKRSVSREELLASGGLPVLASPGPGCYRT
jgi:SprT-like family